MGLLSLVGRRRGKLRDIFDIRDEKERGGENLSEKYGGDLQAEGLEQYVA
jgi:hypothetical protein